MPTPTSGRLLAGPLVVAAAGFGLGWLALGAVAVTLRIPRGGWAIVALLAVLVAAATFVVGYRSAVRMSEHGLRIPGRPALAWDQVTAVRLAPVEGGWAPLLDVARGRALELVELDGLVGRRPDGRVLRQATALADAAGCPLEIATPPDPGAAAPSRAA